MKKVRSLLVLGALVVCAGFLGCSRHEDSSSGAAISTDTGGPVAMKLKWRVGKRYDHRMTLDQTLKLQVAGSSQVVEQDTSMSEDFSMSALKDLSAGGTEVEMKITREKMNSKVGGKSLNFDSAQDPALDSKDPTAATFRKIAGAHFKYEMDADGIVQKINGINEFVAGISSDPQTQAAIKQTLNEDTLKQLGMRGQGLPAQPVKAGDHWPFHLEMEIGPAGALTMNVQYTFRGWQQHDGKKCALLEFSGDTSDKSGAPANGIDITVTKGSLTGSTWFDPELGMAIDTQSDQNMGLKIVARGKTMTGTLHQHVGVKVVEVADLPQ